MLKRLHVWKCYLGEDLNLNWRHLHGALPGARHLHDALPDAGQLTGKRMGILGRALLRDTMGELYESSAVSQLASRSLRGSEVRPSLSVTTTNTGAVTSWTQTRSRISFSWLTRNVGLPLHPAANQVWRCVQDGLQKKGRTRGDELMPRLGVEWSESRVVNI